MLVELWNTVVFENPVAYRFPNSCVLLEANNESGEEIPGPITLAKNPGAGILLSCQTTGRVEGERFERLEESGAYAGGAGKRLDPEMRHFCAQPI